MLAAREGQRSQLLQSGERLHCTDHGRQPAERQREAHSAFDSSFWQGRGTLHQLTKLTAA